MNKNKTFFLKVKGVFFVYNRPKVGDNWAGHGSLREQHCMQVFASYELHYSQGKTEIQNYDFLEPFL